MSRNDDVAALADQVDLLGSPPDANNPGAAAFPRRDCAVGIQVDRRVGGLKGIGAAGNEEEVAVLAGAADEAVSSVGVDQNTGDNLSFLLSCRLSLHDSDSSE